MKRADSHQRNSAVKRIAKKAPVFARKRALELSLHNAELWRVWDAAQIEPAKGHRKPGLEEIESDDSRSD